MLISQVRGLISRPDSYARYRHQCGGRVALPRLVGARWSADGTLVPLQAALLLAELQFTERVDAAVKYGNDDLAAALMPLAHVLDVELATLRHAADRSDGELSSFRAEAFALLVLRHRRDVSELMSSSRGESADACRQAQLRFYPVRESAAVRRSGALYHCDGVTASCGEYMLPIGFVYAGDQGYTPKTPWLGDTWFPGLPLALSTAIAQGRHVFGVRAAPLSTTGNIAGQTDSTMRGALVALAMHLGWRTITVNCDANLAPAVLRKLLGWGKQTYPHEVRKNVLFYFTCPTIHQDNPPGHYRKN